MSRIVDLVGQKYGRLTVIKLLSGGKQGARWLCQCSCGNTTTALSKSLKDSKSRSCGCLRNEVASTHHTTHGLTDSPVYDVWTSMMQRCTNPNNPNFLHYGGRGIDVCERWKSFENFFTDMGHKPKDLSLDRIDVNDGYSPSNCRWATNKEQGRNTRRNTFIEYNGKSRCLSEWSEITGIHKGTLLYRLRVGWPLGRALGFVR